ncbi:MAG TPA: hypothetical protein VJ600_10045 [Holophagaceae bacterium]|nr:hypothetical protein [Holophagaceae bacterium]
MKAMQRSSLSRPALLLTLAVCAACGKKGDPVPRPPVPPKAVEAHLGALRVLEVRMPLEDVKGEKLQGFEAVRVLYLPLGLVRPTAEEVFSKGQVVLERGRPDVPAPGETVRLDLSRLERPSGWLVVVAVRAGKVAGRPSEPVPWLNPAL